MIIGGGQGLGLDQSPDPLKGEASGKLAQGLVLSLFHPGQSSLVKES